MKAFIGRRAVTVLRFMQRVIVWADGWKRVPGSHKYAKGDKFLGLQFAAEAAEKSIVAG